jgi:hypothetical protein
MDTLYAPGGNTEENKTILQNFITELSRKQAELVPVSSKILSIDPNYQDPELQVPVSDPQLAALGIRRVFDLLRRKHIFLNSSNKIVDNPLTTRVQGGGYSKRRYPLVKLNTNE